MSRPETTADLSEYERQGFELASFSLTEFAANPAAVEAYAAFVRATGKDGAVADVRHGNATVRRPKTAKELKEALEIKQKGWDQLAKRYAEVRDAAEDDTLQDLDSKWSDYEAYGLRTHAEAEDLPVFGLIAKDESVRKAARQSLGIE